jgi:transposase
VKVEHRRGTKFGCPDCQKQLPCYDHGEERQWRHLDSCQFKTILKARVPRVDCPEHGAMSVIVPWAEPHLRFTMLFESLAIEVLEMTQTVNSKMMSIKRREGGYRNIENFKKAIFFLLRRTRTLPTVMPGEPTFFIQRKSQT